MNDLLRATFGTLDSALGAIPLGAARYCAVALLVLPVLGLALAPREWIYRGAPDQRRARDLRWWAAVVTLPYAVLYLLA
jgi:hypothetical protein